MAGQAVALLLLLLPLTLLAEGTTELLGSGVAVALFPPTSEDRTAAGGARGLKEAGRAAFTDDYSDVFCENVAFPAGPFITGVNEDIFKGDSLCGKCLKVTCKRGVGKNQKNPCNERRPDIVVTIVDKCAAPCDGQLVLSAAAFNSIADEDAGVIAVDFKSVECPTT